MFELVNKSLSQIVDFSPDELRFFNQQLQLRHAPKKFNILKTGNQCDFEIFLIKGCVRMYCNNDAEDDLNLGFFTENCWFCDYDSYENLKPSLYTIETLEECTYLVLNKEGKSLLCESSPKFKVAFKTFIVKYTIYLQNRLRVMMATNARNKYLDFLSFESDLLNRIPQYHIASYLGMSPEFVSKVRKKIINHK